jgi:hypothetical protein
LEDVPLKLVSRVYLIGLAPESKQLQDFFFGEEGKSDYQQPAGRGRFNSDLAIWTRIVEDAIAGTSVEDPGHAAVSIDLLLVAFKGVNDAAGKLDSKQVAMDLEYARQEATSGYTPPGYMGAWNVGSYFSYLMALIPQLVVGIERAFQVLLDGAVADLEAGKGNAALAKAKLVLEAKLRPAFEFDRLLSLTLPITRSDFASKTKRHLDYFDERKKAPSAVIHPYRIDETDFSEKDLTIKRIYEIRADQIAVIEQQSKASPRSSCMTMTAGGPSYWRSSAPAASDFWMIGQRFRPPSMCCVRTFPPSRYTRRTTSTSSATTTLDARSHAH